MIISPEVNSNTLNQEKAIQGIYPQSWGQTRPGLLEIAAVNPQYLPQNQEVKTFLFCNNCYYLPIHKINIADFFNLGYNFTIVLHRNTFTCLKKWGDTLCLYHYHQIPQKSLFESTVRKVVWVFIFFLKNLIISQTCLWQYDSLSFLRCVVIFTLKWISLLS